MTLEEAAYAPCPWKHDMLTKKNLPEGELEGEEDEVAGEQGQAHHQQRLFRLLQQFSELLAVNCCHICI